MRCYCIATDAQDLDIVLLEPTVMCSERGGLCGSTTREVEYVEGKDYGLFPLVLAQGNIPFADRRKSEVRGYVANLCCHISTYPLKVLIPVHICEPVELYSTTARVTNAARHLNHTGLILSLIHI